LLAWIHVLGEKRESEVSLDQSFVHKCRVRGPHKPQTDFTCRLKQKAFQLLQLLKKLPIRMPACPDIGFCWQAGEVFWLGEQQTLRYTRANIRTVDVRFATITATGVAFQTGFFLLSEFLSQYTGDCAQQHFGLRLALPSAWNYRAVTFARKK